MSQLTSAEVAVIEVASTLLITKGGVLTGTGVDSGETFPAASRADTVYE